VDAGVDAPVVDADAVPAQPTASCLALPHTCGASRNDDCCNSLVIPGGTFFRGYDVAGDAYSRHQTFQPRSVRFASTSTR